MFACDATGDKDTHTAEPRRPDKPPGSVIKSFVVYSALEKQCQQKKN